MEIRHLTKDDVDIIYDLCKENEQFYRYCPPFVTKQSILDDLEALPPRTTLKDKHYIGFFKDEKLIAMMDLIVHYPDADKAFIGFFMVNIDYQHQNIGSTIISKIKEILKEHHFTSIRLGCIVENKQAYNFWIKNGFIQTKLFYNTDDYRVDVFEYCL